jgi:aspartate 1-decarboxylase
MRFSGNSMPTQNQLMKKELELRELFFHPKHMQVKLLKSKILRARVTEANLDYEGSLGIDLALMQKVGLLPYEHILVGDITNGARFETYAIPAPVGSLAIELNGAVAHLSKVGNLIVIMSFANVPIEQADSWKPRAITLADNNRHIIKQINLDASAEAPAP